MTYKKLGRRKGREGGMKRNYRKRAREGLRTETDSITEMRARGAGEGRPEERNTVGCSG